MGEIITKTIVWQYLKNERQKRKEMLEKQIGSARATTQRKSHFH